MTGTGRVSHQLAIHLPVLIPGLPTGHSRGNGPLGRGAVGPSIGEEVGRGVGEELLLRLHPLEDLPGVPAAVAATERGGEEEDQERPHSMSSFTTLTSLAPSWERIAEASLPSLPGGRATLIQKPSLTAERKASFSNTAWYGWGKPHQGEQTEEDAQRGEEDRGLEGDGDERGRGVRRPSADVERPVDGVHVDHHEISAAHPGQAAGEGDAGHPAPPQTQCLVPAVERVRRVGVDGLEALLPDLVAGVHQGLPGGELAEHVGPTERERSRVPSVRLRSPRSPGAGRCWSSSLSSFTSLSATAGMNLRKRRNSVLKKPMVPRKSVKSTQVGCSMSQARRAGSRGAAR